MPGDGHCCKVQRVNATRDLEFDLASLWVTGGESVRSLAEQINEALVERALRDTGSGPVEGEAENFHRLLTDDDLPDARRLEARRRLESIGVDVESLERAFVSHQTVYNHLTKCLDLSRESTPPDRQDHADTVYALQTRTEAVTAQSVETLRNSGEIELGSFGVVVDIRVYCEECGRVTSIGDLLDAGGCACQLVPSNE